MRRTVNAAVNCQVVAPADIVWSIAVADGVPLASEQLSITVDDAPVAYEEVRLEAGTRLHVCRQVPVGALSLQYSAVIDGQAVPLTPTDIEDVVYRRPSRYVDSDTLAPVAQAEFAGLDGKRLLDTVSSWVGQQLKYVSGASRPTDGAVQTFLARQGVCRDFAHLVIALLRALNVPARLVSVYAPGLDPMDFHAVAEALVDGQWQVVDATALAPRTTLVRIATGRDASDTAFMTVQSGLVELSTVVVSAVVDPALPNDDITMLTQLT